MRHKAWICFASILLQQGMTCDGHECNHSFVWPSTCAKTGFDPAAEHNRCDHSHHKRDLPAPEHTDDHSSHLCLASHLFYLPSDAVASPQSIIFLCPAELAIAAETLADTLCTRTIARLQQHRAPSPTPPLRAQLQVFRI